MSAFGAGSYPEPPDEGRIRMGCCPICDKYGVNEGTVFWCHTHDHPFFLSHEEDIVSDVLADIDLAACGAGDNTCFATRIECPVCKGTLEVQLGQDGEVLL